MKAQVVLYELLEWSNWLVQSLWSFKWFVSVESKLSGGHSPQSGKKVKTWKSVLCFNLKARPCDIPHWCYYCRPEGAWWIFVASSDLNPAVICSQELSRWLSTFISDSRQGLTDFSLKGPNVWDFAALLFSCHYTSWLLQRRNPYGQRVTEWSRLRCNKTLFSIKKQTAQFAD